MKIASIRNSFIAIVAVFGIGVSVIASTQTVDSITSEIKENITGAQQDTDTMKVTSVSDSQTSVVLALNEDVSLVGEADHRYNLLVFSKSLAHAEALENINKIKNRGYRPANMNEAKAFAQFMNTSQEIKDMVLTEHQTMIIARTFKESKESEKTKTSESKGTETADKKTASNASGVSTQQPAKNGS